MVLFQTNDREQMSVTIENELPGYTIYTSGF